MVIIGTFILAVMPWDIMMSRWALDCNYLTPFLLFGLLFLIKARKHDSRYLLLSMRCSMACPCTAMPQPGRSCPF